GDQEVCVTESATPDANLLITVKGGWVGRFGLALAGDLLPDISVGDRRGNRATGTVTDSGRSRIDERQLRAYSAVMRKGGQHG
ncbi:hypothetical protein AB0J68_26785, partial [Micromonospora sp. NPDC049580]|uniref:hypothetical protein n=1 Tax=Micromonospora sp. NPDC049580 TaxID=3154832 RepID=UPI0034211940